MPSCPQAAIGRLVVDGIVAALLMRGSFVEQSDQGCHCASRENGYRVVVWRG